MAGRGRGRGHVGVPQPQANTAYYGGGYAAHPGYAHAMQAQPQYYYMQGPGGQVVAMQNPALLQQQQQQAYLLQQQQQAALQRQALMTQQPGQVNPYGQQMQYAYQMQPNGQYQTVLIQQPQAQAYQVQMGQQQALAAQQAAGQQAAHSSANAAAAQTQMRAQVAAQPMAPTQNRPQPSPRNNRQQPAMVYRTQQPNPAQGHWQQQVQFPTQPAQNGRAPATSPSSQSTGAILPANYDRSRTVLISGIPTSRDGPKQSVSDLFGYLRSQVGTFHMKHKANINNGACYIELDNIQQKQKLVDLYKANSLAMVLHNSALTIDSIDEPAQNASKKQPVAKSSSKGATPRSSKLSVNAAEFSMGASVTAQPFVPTGAKPTPPLPTRQAQSPSAALAMPSLERGDSKPNSAKAAKQPANADGKKSGSPTSMNLQAKPFRPSSGGKGEIYRPPHAKQAAPTLDTSAIDVVHAEPLAEALDTSAIDAAPEEALKGNLNMGKGDLSKGNRQPAAKGQIPTPTRSPTLVRVHSEPVQKGDSATVTRNDYKLEFQQAAPQEDEKTSSTADHRPEQEPHGNSVEPEAEVEVEEPEEPEEDDVSAYIVEEDNYATDESRRRHTMNYLWTFRKRYQGDEIQPKPDEVERMTEAGIFVHWLQANQFIKEMMRNKKYEQLNERGPGGKKVLKSKFQIHMEKERSDPTKQLKRKSHGILNKMCPDKYNKMAGQLKEVMNDFVDKGEDMSIVVEGIFQKACLMPQYVVLYADLAAELNEFCPKKLMDQNRDDLNKIFRRQILNCCQQQFESGFNQEAGITQHFTEEEKLIQRTKNKKKMFGNIQFIACLFIRNLVKEALVHKHIIPQLLQSSGSEQEGATSMHVEAVCVLLESCGAQLDHEKARRHIDAYIKRLEKLAKNCERRIQFRVEALQGLREEGWPKSKTMKTAKTIKEFRADHLKAEQERIAREARQKERDRRGGRYSGGFGGGRNDRRNSQQRRGGNQQRREAPAGQWVAAKGRQKPNMRRTKSLGQPPEGMNDGFSQQNNRRNRRRGGRRDERNDFGRAQTARDRPPRPDIGGKGREPNKMMQREEQRPQSTRNSKSKKGKKKGNKSTPQNRFAFLQNSVEDENNSCSDDREEESPKAASPQPPRQPPAQAKATRAPRARDAGRAPKDKEEYIRQLKGLMDEYFTNNDASTLHDELVGLESACPKLAEQVGNPVCTMIDHAFEGTRGASSSERERSPGKLADFFQFVAKEKPEFLGPNGLRDALSEYLEFYSTMIVDNPNLPKMLATILMRACRIHLLDPFQLKAWLDGDVEAGSAAREFVKTNSEVQAKAQGKLLAEIISRGIEEICPNFFNPNEGLSASDLLRKWFSQVRNDKLDVQQWAQENNLSPQIQKKHFE